MATNTQLAATPEAVAKIVRGAGLAMLAAAALSLVVRFSGSAFFSGGNDWLSSGIAVAVGLAIAGAFALAKGSNDAQWALGCVAGATLFTSLVIRYGVIWDFGGTLLVLCFAAGVAITGAALAVNATKRTSPFAFALNPRTAPYGLTAAVALGLSSLSASPFSVKFFDFDTAFSYSFLPTRFKAAELFFALALAASSALAVFVGTRGAIATASVVLAVPVFYIADALADWPGTPSIGFILLLAGVALEVVVIILSVKADRALTLTAEIPA